MVARGSDKMNEKGGIVCKRRRYMEKGKKKENNYMVTKMRLGNE